MVKVHEISASFPPLMSSPREATSVATMTSARVFLFCQQERASTNGLLNETIMGDQTTKKDGYPTMIPNIMDVTEIVDCIQYCIVTQRTWRSERADIDDRHHLIPWRCLSTVYRRMGMGVEIGIIPFLNILQSYSRWGFYQISSYFRLCKRLPARSLCYNIRDLHSLFLVGKGAQR